jgi:threo-3-hydroxy-L-aspartate ammonia-lyase
MELCIPTHEDVVMAAERLRGVAHLTPVLTSRFANELAGAELFFKCENFQRAGAFKFRGAYNSISQFSDAQKNSKGVLAYSSGNHSQAIALSARLLGIHATIVMPKDSPKSKVDATQEYGAKVIFYDRYRENRELITEHIQQETGGTLIPPFDHPHVIAGQGTATLELIQQTGPLDYLITPLGGGGLLAGAALAAKAGNPEIRLIGVEPEAGNDGQLSLKKGEIVTIPTPQTIADGAQTTALGRHTFPIIQRYVDEIVTVTDLQLVKTMKFFAERMKILVEPTGCLAAAAALEKVIPLKSARVGVVISGGNVDLERLKNYF